MSLSKTDWQYSMVNCAQWKISVLQSAPSPVEANKVKLQVSPNIPNTLPQPRDRRLYVP
jgi:hypothetical protein